MSIDFSKERKRLESQASTGKYPPFWSPGLGEYEVVILENRGIQEREFTDEDGKTVKRTQLLLNVVVKGNEGWMPYTFAAAKGKTLASKYGQLIKIGDKHGELVGSKLTIEVSLKKGRKNYDIAFKEKVDVEEYEKKQEEREEEAGIDSRVENLIENEKQVALSIVEGILDCGEEKARVWAGGHGYIIYNDVVYTGDEFERVHKGEGGKLEEKVPVEKVKSKEAETDE